VAAALVHSDAENTGNGAAVPVTGTVALAVGVAVVAGVVAEDAADGRPVGAAAAPPHVATRTAINARPGRRGFTPTRWTIWHPGS